MIENFTINTLRPMMKISEMFPYLKEKNIKFEKMTDTETENYLRYNFDIDKDTKLENIPVWEFLEIITFGDLVNFYEFFSLQIMYNMLKFKCKIKEGDKKMKEKMRLGGGVIY